MTHKTQIYDVNIKFGSQNSHNKSQSSFICVIFEEWVSSINDEKTSGGWMSNSYENVKLAFSNKWRLFQVVRDNELVAILFYQKRMQNYTYIHTYHSIEL